MAFNRLRRALVLAVCTSSALLAACGGGDVESQLKPTRIVAFGDGFSDLGQTGARYTVNDGTLNVWTAQLASKYGLSLTAAAAGGQSYATGNARVVAKPDAAGNNATPTVKEQIDSFLSTQSIGSNDMVVIGGGISDVVAEIARANAGSQTTAQALSNIRQAGRDMGAQVRRLVQAGGKFVVVVGSYNLGKSPWAISTGQVSLLADASNRFNEDLLVSIVELGANVLYVDAALHYNLVTSAPSNYSLSDVSTPACTSVDPGPGIGTGAGQVNSKLCTPATLLPGIDPGRYLFADRLYPMPQGHRLFGDYAYERIKNRF